ncbi:DNA polymerase-3 subunit gamma/tau [Thermoactinomyces sp. DSM 45891]|uniref:DNA polymerase III subunit gamma/tau n=1 Tax=Thermoactinomyces sp. DSM 45891 TaxID=1761907 RepID=UPI00090F73EE|nr:DNA polymerase III subunit gamma/tau [Thermoactinomyces sp. DSM 45891]SFX31954.1 DNA polymerase-3 subunit gamma/tau [Thermoactinomyces sp. DSM 45891]
MSYRALYRVWRSQRFEDLVGQEYVTRTLQNAIVEQQLSHAYLFSGPRGTGKTSAAKIFAKAVNCENGPAAEPCNQCEICRQITDGSSMDVFEMDAASNRGVDEIRDLRDKVKYAPTEARYKVYIIDEVHMLTTEAFNALLKTLEEPPPHVIFILATTEPHKLLPTIISRCQRFSFRRISFEVIVKRLQLICETNQIRYEDQALFTLARTADGGMRDALSLLDQTIAFGGEVLTEEVVRSVLGIVSKETMYQLIQGIHERNPSLILQLLDQLSAEGNEPDRILYDLVYTCRDLLLIQTAPKVAKLQGAEQNGPTAELAMKVTTAQLQVILDSLLQDQPHLKHVSNPRIFLEMSLLRAMNECVSSDRDFRPPSQEIQLLHQKIEQLEKIVERLAQPSHDQSQVVVNRESLPAEVAPRPSLSKPTIQKGKKLSPQLLAKISPKALQRIQQSWSDILNKVRNERVTVHAWLVNGEPVAATDQMVILAFKTEIHCETTERQPNRGIIEQVISQTLQHTYQIQTVMWSDWELVQSDEQQKSSSEMVEDRVVSKRQESPNQMGSARDSAILDQAITIFGKDLVQIKKD